MPGRSFLVHSLVTVLVTTAAAGPVARPSADPAPVRQSTVTTSADLPPYRPVERMLAGAGPAPVGEAARLDPDRPANGAAAAAAWTDCAEDHWLFIDRYYFDCRHRIPTSPPIFVNYNIDGISRRPGGGNGTPVPGLPPVDNDGNGVPDAADKMVASFAAAFDTYRTMGFEIDGSNVAVYVGVDSNDNPGITFPGGGLLNGTPIILMPSDPGRSDPAQYTYLPRHELFHAFQYHYMTVDHFTDNVISINWWMEATAEWATHQVYARTGERSPGWDYYSRGLPAFLGDPEQGLNAHDGLGGSRQYGAFVLAQYLSEQTDFRFVLRTWQAMAGQLPIYAIAEVLAGYGLDLSTELAGFALANYRLTTPSAGLGDFVGAADGYDDSHAATTWRERLSGGRPARAAGRSLGWGQSVSGSTDVRPGGAAYLEFTAPSSGSGRARIRVEAPDTDDAGGPVGFRYLLVTFNDLTSRVPQRWTRADAVGTDARQQELTVDLMPGETATLIAVRSDVRARSNEAAGSPVSVRWTAELTAGTPVPAAGPNEALNAMWARHANRTGYATMCDDWSGGDGTQSVLLPSGRRAWFFSDTYLGDGAFRPTFDKSILRNSIVVQRGFDPASATLTTVTGGNTCQERNTERPLVDRYAYSPVRSNVSGPDVGGEFYWSGSGKVLGDNVVWFYLKGNGFAFRNSSMVVIPAGQLDNGRTVNAVPMDLPAYSYYGTDNPIVWGSSVVDDADGFTYVYGWAVVDAGYNKKPFLARVPRARLTDFSAWRFYAGGERWSAAGGAAGQTAAVPLGTGFTDPMYSVVTLNGRHWLVTLDPQSRHVVAHPATKLWGFGPSAVDLYTPPERLQQSPDFKLIYDLHVHEGLAQDSNTLVVSYNVNSTGVNIGCRPEIDYVPAIYRAKFVNISKNAFRPAAARTVDRASAAVPKTPPPGDARAGRGARSVPRPAPGVAPAKASAAVADTAYYNTFDYQRDIDRQNNHVGCPYLPAPTGLTSKTLNNWGWVDLNWNAIGPDVGYQVYEYNVTKQERRHWPWDWNFGPPRVVGAMDGHPDDLGNIYEWYLVPVNAWGQPETTMSNKTQSRMPIM